MTKRQFYVVWNPAAGPPSMRHPSEGEARREAERLARAHPMQEFLILRSVGTCMKSDVVWIDHESDDVDGMPF